MSGKYVPPHLRGKAKEVAPVKTGVHFPSNTTGDNSRNVSYKKASSLFRTTENSRSTKYKRISKHLATRKLRSKPLKSGLKKGKTARYRRHTA